MQYIKLTHTRDNRTPAIARSYTIETGCYDYADSDRGYELTTDSAGPLLSGGQLDYYLAACDTHLPQHNIDLIIIGDAYFDGNQFTCAGLVQLLTAAAVNSDQHAYCIRNANLTAGQTNA